VADPRSEVFEMADQPGEASSSVRPLRPLIAIAAAGLLAGFGAFGLGELAYGRFSPELVAQTLGGNQVMRPTLETKAASDARNAAVAFGSLGGLLGLFLGLAGGLERRSIGSAARAGFVGLVLGATAGAVLPLLAVVLYYRILAERTGDNLLISVGLHATLWGTLGAVAGLAFGIGRGRPSRTLRLVIGGLAGAVVGTIVYDAIGAVAAPLAGTADAISATWSTRLLARLLVAIGAAVAIDLTIRATESPG
jgi:hypothetical protein